MSQVAAYAISTSGVAGVALVLTGARARSGSGAAPKSGMLAPYSDRRSQVGELLLRAGSDGGSALGHRLRIAGVGVDPAAFRTRQALATVGGFACGLALSLATIAFGARLGSMQVLMAAAASGAACWAGFESFVSRSARRRREMIGRQVPMVADLLCLAVVAGESLRSSLERVAAEVDGPLAEEFESVLSAVAAGAPLIASLESVSSAVRVPQLSRFVETLAIASERGTPLADQLQVLAGEVRADYRRQMLERAGRRQMLMLIPVVLLVLPTALVFAFFPGFMALRFFVR